MPSFFLLNADLYLSHSPQISGLIVKKGPTKILAKYSDFADIFSPKLATKLPEHTEINDYAIKLVNSQQPPYKPIYTLEPMELKTIKAYIEINLANGFIRPSKLPANTPNLFDQKLDGFFHLYINH